MRQRYGRSALIAEVVGAAGASGMSRSVAGQGRPANAGQLKLGALSPLVPAKVFGPGGLVGWNRCRPRHLVYWGAPRVMELNLHANATTTPKVRSSIQRSKRPVAELASE